MTACHHLRYCAKLAALLTLSCASLYADRPEDTFSLIYENDVFGGSDKYYTNGLQLTWNDSLDVLEGSGRRFALLDQSWLPFYGNPGERRVNSYAIGQQIFTPANLNLSAAQPNDRPYAGWLYASAIFSKASDDELTSLGLSMGVIGPYSYAGDVQKGVHDVFTESDYPRGWGNQLSNHFGFLVSYQKTWRVFAGQSGSLAWDLLPNAGAAAGNIYVQASVGALGRIGWHLDQENFGNGSIRPGSSPTLAPDLLPLDKPAGWRFYFFGGVQGLAVAYDVFLTESSSGGGGNISREPLVGYAQAGFTFAYDWFKVSYAQIYQTKTFNKQTSGLWSGALTLSGQF